MDGERPGPRRRRTPGAASAPRRPRARRRRCGAAARRASAVTPSCSACAASCRSSPTWRRSVSSRSPSARPSMPPGSPSSALTASASEATPCARSSSAHRCSRACSSSQRASPAPASASRPSRGTASARRRARAPRAPGRSSASSSASQSRAERVPNTLPAPPITTGMAAASSASRIAFAWRCVRRSTAMSPGTTAAASDSSRSEVGREVARHVLARGGRARVAGAREAPRPGRRADDPHAQRRARQRPRHAPRRRAYAAVHDAGMPELGAAEERVVGVQEALVAAPVDVERRARAGLLRGLEVGETSAPRKP